MRQIISAAVFHIRRQKIIVTFDNTGSNFEQPGAQTNLRAALPLFCLCAGRKVPAHLSAGFESHRHVFISFLEMKTAEAGVESTCLELERSEQL